MADQWKLFSCQSLEIESREQLFVNLEDDATADDADQWSVRPRVSVRGVDVLMLPSGLAAIEWTSREPIEIECTANDANQRCNVESTSSADERAAHSRC